MNSSCFLRNLAGSIILCLLLSCIPVQAAALELPENWEQWLVERLMEWYEQEGEMPETWQDLIPQETEPAEAVLPEALPEQKTEMKAAGPV